MLSESLMHAVPRGWWVVPVLARQVDDTQFYLYIYIYIYMGMSQNFELVTALPIYDLDLFSTRSSMPRDPNVDLPAALHLYLNHRKNRGNTKHVRDGHWFVEIDGNLVHK